MTQPMDQSRPLSFWRTLILLLRATRTKSNGRAKRQQQLMGHRTGKISKLRFSWPWVGFIFAILFTAVIHWVSAYFVYEIVISGQKVEWERQGKLVVDADYFDAMKYYNSDAGISTEDGAAAQESIEKWFNYEARKLARSHNGAAEDYKRKLVEINSHKSSGSLPKLLPGLSRNKETSGIVSDAEASFNTAILQSNKSLAAMMGSIILILWALMVVCQGEGLELDLQRRRHPIWEWLLSHPVKPGAIFMAEMLAPLVSNPLYCTAPLFVGFLYHWVFGLKYAILATVLIGIPLAIALAFLGKALEIAVTLRFPLRSRGAMIGLMSWFGFASMMLVLLGGTSFNNLESIVSRFPEIDFLPWPWLSYFLGSNGESFSVFRGIIFCSVASCLICAGSVWSSAWSAREGLSGNFGKADAASQPSKLGHFGTRPLYRKELLWFIRDRSAVVQAILIPLSVSALQLFNMRGLIAEAGNAWNQLCGLAILFGTYFLWVLGPKSLGSEGNCLWIPLTWPHGMEALLKAKAWLWTIIASAIVSIILIYALAQYPADAWKILLVAIGWMFFGRSMAEKAVTLVRLTSSSGEQENISLNQKWATSLGMLTFATGTLTQQWDIAIMGIVYSYITATAMWENFRARLPYLYDPWSEPLPQAPTLMHAMIAISILAEVGAVLTGIGYLIYGKENIALIHAVVYGATATIVSISTFRFLQRRHVSLRSIWTWPLSRARQLSLSQSICAGIAGGALLGSLAHVYQIILMRFPAISEMMNKSLDGAEEIHGLWLSNAIIAIGFAPFAEEYLFRGLVFRILDRQWGGWKAILGSAAFFAIYHPALAWIPVGLLGIINALIFKRTGWLAPAVLLHIVYNAVVILWN